MEKLKFECNLKTFWKTCQTHFLNNNVLLEESELLSKQKDITSISKTKSEPIPDYLNLSSWSKDTQLLARNDTVNSIIEIFDFYPTINAINKKCKVEKQILV